MKVEVLDTFKMSKDVKNLKRANKNLNAKGFFYKGDTFECDNKLADLLLSKNLIIVLKQEKVDDLVNPPVEKKKKTNKK